jgi:hypothetical protein
MYPLFLLILMVVSAPSDWLKESRASFFRFGSSGCEAEILYNRLEATKTNSSPLFLAYKGMARASMAECAFNPAAKLKRFNQGKELLDQAVQSEPENAEIRLMRLSVQLNAPGFLNYSSDIATDRALIIAALSKNPMIFADNDFTRKVLTFVTETARPTESERQIIKQLNIRLEHGN